MTATRSTGTRVEALRFDGEALRALDQTALPWREHHIALRTAAEVAEAIRRLSIRGAPLIGVAAAYGVALELARDPTAAALERACGVLRDARPTAVNLAAAVDRVQRAAAAASHGARAAAALKEAQLIEREEVQASQAIASGGADLLERTGARRILTHCNTGALAAPGRGTALAVIAELADRGTLEKAIATESRPLLQGARLTVYELSHLEIAHELVVDSAAAGLIAAGAADAVIVGCDRVAANGDVANKVGTYGLALAARAANIPFVVAGPTSTIDPNTPSGADIVIEERDPDEVRLIAIGGGDDADRSTPPGGHAAGWSLTLPGTPCRNPAFDVTPAELVTALVTERGITQPPTAESIAALRPARR